MTNIIYKKLFEVQLLHEYYLTNSDGTTVFSGNVNKTDFLVDRFGKDIPCITDSLLYEVPAPLQNVFKNFHLHLVANYSGFSVLTRVTEQIMPGGITMYQPFVKIPGDFNILVKLAPKDNLLNVVTNARFGKAIPAAYYFTNEDIITAKKFPVLSAAIPLFDPAYSYEQGELYVDGANKIFQFGLADAIEGTGYANTRDQLIVPLQFTYVFNKADNVTEAKFELKDSTGKIIRSYEFKNDVAFQKLTINFSNNQSPNLTPPIEKIVTLPASNVSTENIYTLNVTVNNIKTLMHTLIFLEDDNSVTGCWGIVNIKSTVTNADFCLYNTDGTIKYSKNSDGTIATPAPVFEVRLKSRIIYWRYVNDLLGKLKLNTSDPFLERDGKNNLVTKKPRSSSFLPTLYKDASDNSFHYLPNPASSDNIKVEGSRILTDILVPESKLFPLDSS